MRVAFFAAFALMFILPLAANADNNTCANVTCNSPPPFACNGSAIVSYYAPGFCTDGVCNYVPYYNTTCPYGCSLGQCNNFCDVNTCNANSVTCPDGFISTCQRECDRASQQCLPCVPGCQGHNNTGCADSDGGRTYNTQGTVTDPAHLVPPTRTDYCLKDSYNDNALNYINGSPESYIIEMYCNSNGFAMSDIYNCTYGCSNGTCLANQSVCSGFECNPNNPQQICVSGQRSYCPPGYICRNSGCVSNNTGSGVTSTSPPSP